MSAQPSEAPAPAAEAPAPASGAAKRKADDVVSPDDAAGVPDAAAAAPDAAAAPSTKRSKPDDAAAPTKPAAPPTKRAKPAIASDYEAGIGWPSRRPRAPRYRHGWFLPTHERVFEKVLPKDATCVLELGSWYGSSTEWLAERCPNATIYAVDLWEDGFILKEQRDHYSTMGESKLEGMLRRHPLYDTFLANLWDHRDRVVPLKMQTVAGVELLKKHGVKPQVIYIDADHHYEAVKKDIAACLDNFPDAICVGDDYGHYDDVRNAVNESAAKYDKTVHVDQNHCWTYAPLATITGRTFKPKPKATDSFASLLAGYK